MIRPVAQPSARAVTLWCVLVAVLIGSACTIRLVADYDEHIDAAATALQQQMDAHLTELEALGSAPAAAYAASEAFYRGYGVRLRTVQLRAQGHARNDITLRQLTLMANSLEELRAQHELGGTLSPAFIDTARELFNSGWASIMAWEIAKKRGG